MIVLKLSYKLNFFRGGLFAGYCGPPKVEGVCCVFSSSRCEKRITDRVAYFTNPGFPRNDVEPYQCMLSIKPAKDVCWIRFDLETFELAADGAGGQCTFDSMVILNSPSGPGGQLCGHKTGYSILAKSPLDKDLKLSVLTQGPSYRWNIKISQLKCNELASLPSNSNCGGSNPNGTGGTFQRSLSKKIMRRKKIRRMTRSATSPSISRVAQKKLRNEKFFPSFTARNTFCTPKIRQGNQNNILTKIIDGTETGINEYPWMVSLQLSGKIFDFEHFLAILQRNVISKTPLETLKYNEWYIFLLQFQEFLLLKLFSLFFEERVMDGDLNASSLQVIIFVVVQSFHLTGF